MGVNAEIYRIKSNFISFYGVHQLITLMGIKHTPDFALNLFKEN